jgi:hypothetical protein
MDQIENTRPDQRRRIVIQAGAVRWVRIEKSSVQIHQADQVTGVLRNQPVLLLAPAQGGFGAEAGLLVGAFLERIEDGRRQPLETGLENAIVGAFTDAFDGNFSERVPVTRMKGICCFAPAADGALSVHQTRAA